jgi:hypothetical protein
MNVELPMTNDERMSNDEFLMTNNRGRAWQAWIRHSFDIRHSTFVILSTCVIRYGVSFSFT